MTPALTAPIMYAVIGSTPCAVSAPAIAPDRPRNAAPIAASATVSLPFSPNRSSAVSPKSPSDFFPSDSHFAIFGAVRSRNPTSRGARSAILSAARVAMSWIFGRLSVICCVSRSSSGRSRVSSLTTAGSSALPIDSLVSDRLICSAPNAPSVVSAYPSAAPLTLARIAASALFPLMRIALPLASFCWMPSVVYRRDP